MINTKLFRPPVTPYQVSRLHVIDDYDLIRKNAVHTIVNDLLAYPPQNMHLVIITRMDPSLNINSLRAYSRVHEIRMKELSFNEEETAKLFKTVLDLDLPDETIQNQILQIVKI